MSSKINKSNLNILTKEITMKPVLLILALAVVGCAEMTTTKTNSPTAGKTTAVEPSKTGFKTGPAVFADFGKFPKTSNQGAEFYPTVYSERKGDASISSITVVNNAAVVQGQIGSTKGSQWAGVGFMIAYQNNDGAAVPADFSSYKSVKISLASGTVNSLRVRIAGDDQKAVNVGCYPVFTQAVTEKMTEYTIPLSKFEPEAYCDANGRSIKSTLGRVVQMEVVDVNNQRNKPTEFSVGKIEFMQ
jgi:hypothetical protein